MKTVLFSIGIFAVVLVLSFSMFFSAFVLACTAWAWLCDVAYGIRKRWQANRDVLKQMA